MGLGDLLNLDYGYSMDGGPGWDLGYTGDLPLDYGEMFGPFQQFGPAGTINLPLPDGQFGPAGTISVPEGGIPYDQIPNYGSYPGDTGPDGTVNPGGGGGALKKLLDQLSKPGGSGGSSGSGGSGGGGSIGISAPSISSPVADRIAPHPVPAMQTGTLPAPPPPGSDFRPVVAESRQEPDMQGLARIFAAAMRGAR